jgi:hypothetical protein
MVPSPSTVPPPPPALRPEPVKRFFLTYVESLGLRIMHVGPDYVFAVSGSECVKYTLCGDGIAVMSLSGPSEGRYHVVMTWGEIRCCMAMQAN